MPYIKQEDRPALDHVVSQLAGLRSAGELNYFITRVLQSYLNYHGENYAVLNEVVGALECAKLEFYRRVAAPYENQKISENGDVYR